MRVKVLTLGFVLVFFACLEMFKPVIVFANPGDLDLTFGGTGFVTTQLSVDGVTGIGGVATQTDGKIVGVGGGTSQPGALTDGIVVRYNINGEIDTTFGVNGFVVTSNNDSDSFASVKIQTDGKIIAGGTAQIGTTTENRLYVMRYNSAGTVDNSFGNNGEALVRIGFLYFHVKKLQVQNDGKILVFGTAQNSDMLTKPVIVRLNSDGAVDTTFGVSGLVTISVGAMDDYLNSGLIQKDGKILISGASYRQYHAEAHVDYDLFVIRYNADGSLDNSFANSGVKVFTLNEAMVSNYIGFMSIQSDGKIALCANEWYWHDDEHGGALPDTVLFRLNPDGSTDNTFGINGKVIANLTDHEFPTGITTQIDGKILVTGEYYGWYDNEIKFGISRFNINGTVDQTFGNNGFVMRNLFGYGYPNQPKDIFMQYDGKIVVGGMSYKVGWVARIEGDPPHNISVASSNPSTGVPMTVDTIDILGQGDGITEFARTYPNGMTVNLTAPASFGHNIFSGWTGCDLAIGSNCKVTIDSGKTLFANYYTPSYTVTTINSNLQAGTINSLPDGIACGADCTENYIAGTTVTLSAVPARGYSFAGWSDGTGSALSCTGTSTCTFTIDADSSIKANFVKGGGKK